MRFSAVTLVLPVLAAASPLVLVPRADLYTTIIANLQTTDSDVKNFTAYVNTLSTTADPGLAAANQLQGKSDTVNSDIVTTTGNANKSDVGTATESTNIFNYLNQTLYPDTVSLLNAIVAHKTGFSIKLKKTVHDDLVQARDNVNILSNSLTAKATGTAKSNAPALQQKFIAAFNSAISAYT